MSIILGVDPGLKGALALIDASASRVLHCLDMPVCATGVDDIALWAALSRWTSTYGPLMSAAVEHVHAMPQQGVSSAFAFGEGFGSVRALIGAAGFARHYVRAAKWKAAMRLSKDKNASRALAMKMFPHDASLFSRVKDDGRAEAALLALYGARFLM